MSRVRGSLVRAALCVTLVTIGVTTSAYAADQVVKNNSDSGTGSLRQAIADVHSGGTITFDDDYTITLQSSLPKITKEITIIGRGCKQTIIDGGGNYRAFNVRSGGTLTLKHLTARNGSNIENSSGNLTLDGVDLHGNTGYIGAVQQEGSEASLTILNSAIYGNTATSHGGALQCTAGTVVVKNSTIFDNTSEYYGGGVCLDGGTMTIDSCTIAYNQFSGNYGSAKGGGIILRDGTLVIQNTIVANNQQDSGANDFYYMGGMLTNYGYNFVEVSSTSDSTGFANGVNDDIVGIDPTGLAGSLTYEGGWTPVLKVTAGNIGGANYGSTTETRDQRGYHRKSTEITRGAYQYDGIVAALNFDAWDSGYTTIAAAVAAGSEGDVINIIDTVVKETGITIPKSHAIMGLTTDAQIWGDDEAGTAAGRIFDITGGGVLIKDLSLKYGNVDGDAGAVLNNGTALELTNCVIAGNTSTQRGGGVYCDSDTSLSMSRCTVRDNASGETYCGGGLFARGTVSITHSTFSGNSAEAGAGAYFNSGVGVMQDCTICGNTSQVFAGGVANWEATLTLANCTISGNAAVAGDCGGFGNWGGDAGLLNTNVINNTASTTDDIYVYTGAVYAQNSWYHGVYGSVTTPATASNVTTAYTAGDLLDLADNGGSTLTMRLSPTAPAVGTGDFVYYNSTDGYYCPDSNGDYLDAFGSSITPSDPAGDKITTDQRDTTRSAPVSIGAYFQPIPYPIIATGKVSNVDSDSADCAGNVTSEGSSSVTARGVCWSTSSSPTADGDKTTDGSGTGAFTGSITGLRPGTKYYVRAYATNTAGTAYGEQREFTTSATAPTLTTESATKITETTADCGGTITDEGGRSVTQYGVCWNTTGNPTTGDAITVHDMADKSKGASPDKKDNPRFEDTLTGLTKGTTYYFRTYAINKAGTGYGPEKSFKTLGTATAPDLRVTVQAAKETTHVGEEVGFNVDVQNVGNASATGVALRLPLPQGTEFVGIYPAADQTSRAAPLNATVTNGIIEVVLGEVAASQLLKLELVLKAITAGAVTLEAAASCTESVTPATAQAQKDVTSDMYLVITRSGVPFNACGMLGIMSPLLSIAGMLAMRRRGRRPH